MDARPRRRSGGANGTMRFAFARSAAEDLPFLRFCWRLEIEAREPPRLEELVIPELTFDFLYVHEGAVAVLEAAGQREVDVPRQALKTLHTRPLTLVLRPPLVLYGARLALEFAELLDPGVERRNAIVPDAWVEEPVADLEDFARQIERTLARRRDAAPASPAAVAALLHADGSAGWSPRHRRRLHRAVFGMSRREMASIATVHRFLAQRCDFSDGAPRVGDFVDPDLYYDQPQFNRSFKQVTGRSPLAYFEARSALQDNLMAVSYNEPEPPWRTLDR
jgi:hypothetical protein